MRATFNGLINSQYFYLVFNIKFLFLRVEWLLNAITLYNVNLWVIHTVRVIRLITVLTVKMFTESANNTGTVSLVGELKGLNTGLHWVGPQYGHSQCFQFEYNRKWSALIIRIRSVRRLYYSNWKYWIWPKVWGWP